MKHGYWVQGLFTLIAVSACTEDSASTAPPVARFTASPQSSAEFGVATWEVRIDGEDERVIGLDASAQRQVEFIVQPDALLPDERVRLESVYPVAGSFELTKAGAIENATSDAVRRLAVDVHADVGPNGNMIRDDLASTAADSMVRDLRVSATGTYTVGFDYFQHTVTLPFGGACNVNTTRDHGDIYADYGSSGIWAGFNDPNNTSNCASTFIMTVAGNHWDTFHWRVLSKPTNLALGKFSFQSSTLNGASASRANDGNVDGNFADGSVSHTNYEYRPYWEVDLGSSQNLGAVVPFNRTDCCVERLSDFQIFTSNDGSTWSLAYNVVGQAVSGTELPVKGYWRYVAIQLNGSNYLSLAEVQVFPAP